MTSCICTHWSWSICSHLPNHHGLLLHEHLLHHHLLLKNKRLHLLGVHSLNVLEVRHHHVWLHKSNWHRLLPVGFGMIICTGLRWLWHHVVIRMLVLLGVHWSHWPIVQVFLSLSIDVIHDLIQFVSIKVFTMFLFISLITIVFRTKKFSIFNVSNRVNTATPLKFFWIFKVCSW
jgi:hypothetical protein